MFIGAIPTDLVDQFVRVTPFPQWGSAWVCCSGSFRMDQAIHQAAPDIPIHSNDVSLYSTCIGRQAVR